MKRIVSLIGAGALLLSVAGTALAAVPVGQRNSVEIVNTTSALSYTGGNSQSDTAKLKLSVNGEAEVEGNGARTIVTGTAVSTAATNVEVVGVNKNTSFMGCLNCPQRNRVSVGNLTGAQAGTGDNYQDNTATSKLTMGGEAEVEGNGARTIVTGPAVSSAGTTLKVVNVNKTGWSLW